MHFESLCGVVNLGAAVSFDRLISVNSKFTRPEMGESDSRLNVNKRYYIDGNDTLVIPLSGTKLVARASFDPKKLFLPEGEGEFLGSEDLKLYTEVALLGVKNYPYVYDSLYAYNDRSQRMPKMVGFNLPTYPLIGYGLVPIAALAYVDLKYGKDIQPSVYWYGLMAVLGAGTFCLERFLGLDTRADVLSLELEHWSNPYPNSLEDVIRWNEASPGLMQHGLYDAEEYKKDDWKWSIYLRKTIYNSFQVFFQVAKDHLYTRNPRVEWQDYEEAFRDTDDWYWMAKFRFLF